jgi:RND family efflux transporter MFP subunit
MQSMSRIKQFIISVLVLAGIVTFIAFILNRNTQAATNEIKAEQQEVSFVVNAAPVIFSNAENILPVRGQVEPRNIFTLFSEAEGKIMHSSIELGNKVSQKQTLVKIDASMRLANQKMLEQNLRKAQLDYEVAQKTFLRYKNLSQNGNTSTVEYENAKAQLDAAQVQLKTAEQQLETAIIQVKQTFVTAPATGIIVEKKVNQGDFVQPGSPLGTLAETVLLVRCFVPENLAIHSKIGQKVEVVADAFPNKKLSGTIKTIIPHPNEAKLYPVEITLINSAQLISGVGAQVIFKDASPQKSLLIPRTALFGDFKNPSVFVINSKKQPEKRSIKTGKSTGDKVEVLAGLSENELVITNGQSNIEPGKVLANFKIIQ